MKMDACRSLRRCRCGGRERKGGAPSAEVLLDAAQHTRSSPRSEVRHAADRYVTNKMLNLTAEPLLPVLLIDE